MNEKVTLFANGASDERIGTEVERGADSGEAGFGESVEGVWAVDDGVGAGPRAGCGCVDGGRGL